MVKDTTDQGMEVKHQITEAPTGTDENAKACRVISAQVLQEAKGSLRLECEEGFSAKVPAHGTGRV